MLFSRKPADLPSAEQALKGRAQPLPTAAAHFVNHRALKGPYHEGLELAQFGMGCFWGVERIFWKLPGVWVTAVGYAGGVTPNPTTTRRPAARRTGHTEAVLVVFDPKLISYEALLKTFWEGHNPTQGMRQGNDTGTQYRSAIYTYGEGPGEGGAGVQVRLRGGAEGAGASGRSPPRSSRRPSSTSPEAYHQQYLAKTPGGYCGIGGTGVTCPIGVAVEA